jgi:threonine synthase
LTPLVRAPRLAAALGVGELLLKLDTAKPTHSFKDRVVAVATAKARELGLTTRSCGRDRGGLMKEPTPPGRV